MFEWGPEYEVVNESFLWNNSATFDVLKLCNMRKRGGKLGFTYNTQSGGLF